MNYHVSIQFVLFIFFASGQEKVVNFYDIDEVPGFTAAWNETEAVLTEAKIPGLVLTIVHGDGNSYKVWSKTYGVPDITKPNISIDFKKHRFPIGSISKTFASTLLGILLTRRKKTYPFGWKTKVKDIMGNSISLEPSIENKVTLEHLLSHRTGLYQYSAVQTMGMYLKPTQEYCRRMKVLNGTGKLDKYHYNNFMYMLVECIIEKIGNNTYVNLLREEIFHPLGMANTLLIGELHSINYKNVPMMFYKNSTYYLNPLDIDLLRLAENFHAAGGIVTTGFDMVKWIIFHLDKGKFDSGKNIFDQNLWEEMHYFHSEVTARTNTSHEVDYGLGWFLESFRAVMFSNHGGRIAGFDSRITLARDNKFGIFTSANGPAYNSHTYQVVIHKLIYNIFHNETLVLSWPSSTILNQSFDHTYLLARKLDAYIGSFGSYFFGNFTILQTPGTFSKLYFKYGLFGKGYLFPLNETFFKPMMEGSLAHYHQTTGAQSYMFKLMFKDLNTIGLYDKLDVIGDESTATFIRNYRWDNNEDSKSITLSLHPNNMLIGIALTIIRHTLIGVELKT